MDAEEELEPERVRRAGAGRPGISEREPGLSEALDSLIDPVTRGDPESPLPCTSKSGAKLAQALREMGHQVVDRTVLRLLKVKGYSLQANKKTREGAQHSDRNAQFEHINETVSGAIAAGEPVISVDAKKRELVGDFKAVGREFEPTGKPVEVRGHDFKDKQLGHAIPYAPTPAGPTIPARGSGAGSCSASLTRLGWPSASATSRPAPASGTRSSTACSAS